MNQSNETMTFYGGLNTIGGVHIVVGSGDTGLVFDLGLALRGFFQGEVRARGAEGIRSYLLTRSAPPILQLYDPSVTADIGEQDLERLWNKPFLPSFPNMHVFMSHIHQDHMALLPYLRRDIPVYMHQDAHAVYKAVDASGEYGDTPGAIQPLQDLQEITIGDFKLQIIEVDHDSPGVSGFILRTNEHTIAFTADWRRHGRHSYRMDRFIKLCREAEVDVLITEGTRLRPDTLFRKPTDRKELDVAATYLKVLEQAEGLVYVNILARNVERDIIMATKAAGRTLVMDESTAVLWHVATQEGIVALEDHLALREMETIRVLPNSGPGAMSGAQHKLPYASITLGEMIADKSRYAMYLTYQQLPLMAELERLGETAAPSQYVHADGNPLNHSDETLLRWLSEFGVTYHYCATGGHAAPQEISDLVEGIQPKVVIPLHSIHPTLFDSRGVPRFYPTFGETVVLNQLIGAYAPVVK